VDVAVGVGFEVADPVAELGDDRGAGRGVEAVGPLEVGDVVEGHQAAFLRVVEELRVPSHSV
jgi:hypothetical protein